MHSAISPYSLSHQPDQSRPHLRAVRDEDPPAYDGEPARAPEQRGTFRMVPDCVFDLGVSDATQVYGTLLRIAKASSACIANQKYIAELARLSDRQVRRMLDLLEAKGFLRIDARFAGGMKLPARYVLLAHLHESESPDSSDRTHSPNDRHHVPNGADSQSYRADSQSYKEIHVNVKQEIRKNPPTPQRQPAKQQGGAPNYTPAFLRLYGLMPKKDKKLQALREWEALNPDAALAERIHTALQVQVRSHPRWSEEGARYCPALDGWLRDRRWEETPGTSAAGYDPNSLEAKIARLNYLKAGVFDPLTHRADYTRYRGASNGADNLADDIARLEAIVRGEQP